VLAIPSGLSNGGANFGVWLRAVPLTYTSAFPGYADSGGPFRYIATTLTVPARQDPPANGGQVRVSLGHNGGTTFRPPEAGIGVLPGGGPDSINYCGTTASGAFTISPNVGDQVTVSIYYDQHGHYFFIATDLTQHTTQTVTTRAFYAGQTPLNSAKVLAYLDNDTVVPPPADAQIWQFTGSKVTTYRGDHGTILGPWATSRWIDTTDGTHAGAVVADASVLSEISNHGRTSASGCATTNRRNNDAPGTAARPPPGQTPATTTRTVYERPKLSPRRTATSVWEPSLNRSGGLRSGY